MRSVREERLLDLQLCTDINNAWLDAITEAREDHTPSVPGLFYVPSIGRLKQKVSENIRLFANGKRW